MSLRGTQFIETDALILALENSEELEEHLKQFHVSELQELRGAAARLSFACMNEIQIQLRFD